MSGLYHFLDLLAKLQVFILYRVGSLSRYLASENYIKFLSYHLLLIVLWCMQHHSTCYHTGMWRTAFYHA